MRLSTLLLPPLFALGVAGCDPGYTVARAAGAPIDKETYHEMYGWGDAAGYSTENVIAELRKPGREERMPFFAREYLRRTGEFGVIARFPDLVLDAKKEYVRAALADAVATTDYNVPREHLKDWVAALQTIVYSPRLPERYKSTFQDALRRAKDNPAHFHSLAEEQAKRDADAREKQEKDERKAREKAAKEEEKRRKELEKKRSK